MLINTVQILDRQLCQYWSNSWQFLLQNYEGRRLTPANLFVHIAFRDQPLSLGTKSAENTLVWYFLGRRKKLALHLASFYTSVDIWCFAICSSSVFKNCRSTAVNEYMWYIGHIFPLCVLSNGIKSTKTTTGPNCYILPQLFMADVLKQRWNSFHWFNCSILQVVEVLTYFGSGWLCWINTFNTSYLAHDEELP